MKNKTSLVVIAVTVIIAFSFIACGGDDDKTVTFSLDKLNETTFTLTIQGANWNTVTSDIAGHVMSVYLDTVPSNFWMSFEGERTSNSVLTYTFSEWGIEHGILTGTISFVSLNLNSLYGGYTTGGASKDAYGTTDYRANPAKSSITFSSP